MSANLYSVEDLLIGKPYRSRSIKGVIVDAVKHPEAVHYDNADAYLVRVRPYVGDIGIVSRDTYRSVAVRV